MLDVTTLEMGIRLFIASMCGVMIGFERAYKGKPAGLRTHILISFGSCLFVISSLLISSEAYNAGYAVADPSRIAAQIVTGIGFLGAGAIIRTRGIIRGMTSAATIWCMAAIGLAAGLGLLIEALVSTVSIILFLHIFTYISHFVSSHRPNLCSLELVVTDTALLEEIRSKLRAKNIRLSNEKVQNVLDELIYKATLIGNKKIEQTIRAEIKNFKGVKQLVIMYPYNTGTQYDD